MKIVIAGGTADADFLVASLKTGHTLKVINADPVYAQHLADTYQVPVILGDPCSRHILDAAQIRNYDVLITLSPADEDNLAVCQLAAQAFNIPRTIAITANPRNVAVFKKLGITEAISPAYIAAQQIAQLPETEKR